MSIRASFLGLFAALVLLSGGCLKDSCVEKGTYRVYHPVFRQPQELREGVGIQPARTLKVPGKIYSYGRYLLINEWMEGLHIIDNAEPTAPVFLAFLAIPGNVDMAVYNQVLYADNYMDLIAFDISEVTQPQLIFRQEDRFHHWARMPEGVIIDYIESEETMELDCSHGSWSWLKGGELAVNTAFGNSADAFASVPSGAAQAMGVGGSMARFTIASGHLYVVDQTTLHVFGLEQASQPQYRANIPVGWEIETIFPFRQHLFVGSASGMYIYDIQNPAQPVQRSVFEHARACDPVVTDGDYAYVTLRDGTECQGFINQLEVVDVRNVLKPQLVRTYPMTHPMGLAVRGDYLYLCDDYAGLRIFDKTDVLKLHQNQIAHLTNLKTFDVIALPGSDLLLVIGPDGLRQYDAADPASPVLLSHIPVLP